MVAFHGGGHHRAAALRSATSTVPPSTSTTTSTTIDPGTLGQTTDRPSGTDPTFGARMQRLWAAITSGHAAEGLAAFFPLGAYERVKVVANPASDWQHRLVADFFSDIALEHRSIPSNATLLNVSVPDAAATWVRPGVEFNRIGYWRVYDTVLTYQSGTTTGTIGVISLISWRGQWYVVHFRTPPK